MQKMEISLRGMKFIKAGLICIVALLMLTAALPMHVQLGAPPLAVDLPGVTLVSAPATAAAACTQNCIFLPVIANGQKGADPASRAASLTAYNQEFVTKPAISAGWTGNIASCNPGTTSAVFRAGVLARINFYRQMAGVPNVAALNETYNQEAQAGALMMSASKLLNHTPPSNWKCYTQVGHDAAGKSNLAMGTYGPGAIDLYMDDGGLQSMGHRRWILYPPTTQMGTGDIPGDGSGWQAVTNDLMVITASGAPRPPTREAFVAWPPPGYAPYPLVPAYWSFGYPKADFSAATVSVIVDGTSTPTTRFAQSNGYGDNTLVWSMDAFASNWPRPSEDTTYSVNIQHVKVGGVENTFAYNVIVFDPAKP